MEMPTWNIKDFTHPSMFLVPVDQPEEEVMLAEVIIRSVVLNAAPLLITPADVGLPHLEQVERNIIMNRV